MAARRRIGEVLVEAGLIDELQLQAALGHQRQWGGRLGRILIDNRFLSEDQLVEALSKHMRVPRCELRHRTIPTRLLQELPLELAEKYNCVPVGMKADAKGEVLHIATSDPTNFEAIDAIQFKTGKRVHVMIASDNEVEGAIRRAYYGEQPREVSSTALDNVQFGGHVLDEEEMPVVTGAMLLSDEPATAPPAASAPASDDWFLAGKEAAAPAEPAVAAPSGDGGETGDALFGTPNSFLGGNDELGPAAAPPPPLELPGDPVEAAPIEAAPIEAAPIEAAPIDAAPIEAAPIEAAPIEAAPIEAAPIEAAPIEAAPIEAAPIEAAPVEAQPLEAEPVEAQPLEEEPVEAQRIEAEPVEAEPVEAEPVEAEPVEAEPVEPEPVDRGEVEAIEVDFSDEGAPIEMASAADFITAAPPQDDGGRGLELELSYEGEAIELATAADLMTTPATSQPAREAVELPPADDDPAIELATAAELVDAASYAPPAEPLPRPEKAAAAALPFEDFGDLRDLALAKLDELDEIEAGGEEAPPSPPEEDEGGPDSPPAIVASSPAPRPLPVPTPLPEDDDGDEPPPVEVFTMPPNREPFERGSASKAPAPRDDGGFGDQPLPGDAGDDVFFGLDEAPEEPPVEEEPSEVQVQAQAQVQVQAPPLRVETLATLERAPSPSVASWAASADTPAALANGSAAVRIATPALPAGLRVVSDEPALLAGAALSVARAGRSLAAAVDQPEALARRADGGPFPPDPASAGAASEAAPSLLEGPSVFEVADTVPAAELSSEDDSSAPAGLAESWRDAAERQLLPQRANEDLEVPARRSALLAAPVVEQARPTPEHPYRPSAPAEPSLARPPWLFADGPAADSPVLPSSTPRSMLVAGEVSMLDEESASDEGEPAPASFTPTMITRMSPDELRALAERLMSRGALTEEDIDAARRPVGDADEEPEGAD